MDREVEAFDAFLGNIGDPAYVRDADGRLLYINPAAQSLSGWSLKDALGKRCHEVFGRIEDACNESHGSAEVPTPTGTRTMHVAISSFADGSNSGGAVVILRQVPEPAPRARSGDVAAVGVDCLLAGAGQIEKILAQQVRLQGMLLDSLPQPAMLIRRDRTILAANRIAREAGAEPGKKCWEGYGQSKFIPEEDQEHLRKYGHEPPQGTRCSFCLADECLQDQRERNQPRIEAFGRVWKTCWIPLDQDIYLHYGVDTTEQDRMFHDMAERVKELTCLCGVAKAVREEKDQADAFRRVVRLMPSGWQYPDIARARIVVDGQEYVGESFEETSWKQTSEILANGRPRGIVQLCYLQECPVSEEGPFLTQERDLIDGIAMLLSEAIVLDQAERALMESEETQRVMLQAADDVAFVTTDLGGEDTRVLSFSVGAEKIFGYRAEEIVGQPVRMLHPAEDVSQFPAMQHALIEGGKGHTGECSMVRKSGERFPAYFSVHPRLDGAGNLTGTVCVAIDISDRKRVEEDLREMAERYRALYDNAPLAFQSLDADGCILDVNPTWLRTLGFERSEVIGRWFGDFLPPEGKESFHVRFPEFKRRGYVHDVPFRMVRKDGTTIDVLFEGCIGYTPQGAFKQTYCVFKDITDQQRAEEQLNQKTYYLERSQEIGKIGTWELDLVRNELVWTDEIYRILGTAIGTPQTYDTFLGAVHPADRNYVHQEWMAALQGEPYDIEHRLFVDGEIRWVRERADVEFDEAGNAVKAIGVMQDITDRKLAEQQRVELEAQIRQMQKMEAVGQLAGGVAHDFNNILQAILSYTELATLHIDEDHAARSTIDGILNASHRAKMLVKQLLAFSRRQVLHLEDLDINEVIVDSMNLIHRLIGEHIVLDLVPGRNIRTVRADRGQIAQILTNLCINARDAMPDGGTIAITTENVCIREDYCRTHAWARPGDYVLASVTDTGCGMDETTRGQIFEPFFTTKDVGQGTGLGLSTVYGLVKQHDGQIEVESEVGKGTTFRIYLPTVDHPVAVANDQPVEDAPGGTETILLAEDEPMVREPTRRMLEKMGYTVLVAADGREALQIFREHADEISLALLDVVMPEIGGRAVFDEIRKTHPRVRVLFASGYSASGVHTNFILDDNLMLIQKPYQRMDLLRTIRKVLDGP